MERQVATRCPKTGRTIIVYRDEGPASAVPGHGRPISSTAPPLPGTRMSADVSSGWQVSRLGGAA